MIFNLGFFIFLSFSTFALQKHSSISIVTIPHLNILPSCDVVGHLLNIKKLKKYWFSEKKVSLKRRKTAHKHMKALYYSLLWPLRCYLKVLNVFGYFQSTSGKWLKFNPEIVARYKNFWILKISIANFWKVGSDLGNNFQVLSKP